MAASSSWIGLLKLEDKFADAVAGKAAGVVGEVIAAAVGHAVDVHATSAETLLGARLLPLAPPKFGPSAPAHLRFKKPDQTLRCCSMPGG